MFIGNANIVGSRLVGSAPSFSNEYSFLFDGVDEEISFGQISELVLSRTASFSVWIKPTWSTGNKDVFLGQGVALSVLKGSRLDFYIDSSNSYYVRGSDTLIYNAWNHVLVTIDTNIATGLDKGRIFVNGVNVTTSVNLQTRDINAGTFYIGRGTRYGYFQGNIDQLAVWSTDMRNDYLEIYNGGVMFNLLNLTNKPEHIWEFDDAIWTGSNYTCSDTGSVGGNTGVTANMEESDKVTDVP